jgi:DNA-binding NarL/FixJ family response regulator
MTGPPITLDDLTPREIAVASMARRGWTTKQIAARLDPPITSRRVLCIVSAIALKIGADPDGDDFVQVALWFREQCPVCVPDYAIPIRNLSEIRIAS